MGRRVWCAQPPTLSAPQSCEPGRAPHARLSHRNSVLGLASCRSHQSSAQPDLPVASQIAQPTLRNPFSVRLCLAKPRRRSQTRALSRRHCLWRARLTADCADKARVPVVQVQGGAFDIPNCLPSSEKPCPVSFTVIVASPKQEGNVFAGSTHDACVTASYLSNTFPLCLS